MMRPLNEVLGDTFATFIANIKISNMPQCKASKSQNEANNNRNFQNESNDGNELWNEANDNNRLRNESNDGNENWNEANDNSELRYEANDKDESDCESGSEIDEDEYIEMLRGATQTNNPQLMLLFLAGQLLGTNRDEDE